MDFKGIPKGIFNLRKAPTIDNGNGNPLHHDGDGTLNESSLLQNENLTVERFGFNSAKANNGSAIGLSICLNRVYQDHRNKTAEDSAKQDELKKPYRLKLQEVKSENEGLAKRIEKVKMEEIPMVNSRIDKLKEAIADLHTNPERVTGDKTGKASFYIGLIILLLLTVYLFIFYSSASYSSFFKQFTISELGIANSIFDAQALSKATKDGLTELLLIVTIPAVFLGLGYLIHKSAEQKGVKKIAFIGSLILVTFVFDAIIAYEICEKIYNIKKTNSFQDLPEYNFSLAFQSINFWLIIFAGFVVYIIWGLVFDFTIDAHEKLDRVRTAIRNKEKEITNHEAVIEKLRIEICGLEEKGNKNIGEINKLNELINHTTIIPKEFELYLFHFMQGWLHWMSANLQNQAKQKECQDILTIFIATNIQSLDLTNN